MTYREILRRLEDLTDEQLDCNALFKEPYDDPEYLLITGLEFEKEDEVYEDHPIFV